MKKQKALILIDLQNDYFEGGLYPLVGSLDAVLKVPGKAACLAQFLH